MTARICPPWCRVVDIDSIHRHGPVTRLALPGEGTSIAVATLYLAGLRSVQIRPWTGPGVDLPAGHVPAVVDALDHARYRASTPSRAAHYLWCDLGEDICHDTCVHWVPVQITGIPGYEVPVVRVEQARRPYARARIAFSPAGLRRRLYRMSPAVAGRFTDMLATAAGMDCEAVA